MSNRPGTLVVRTDAGTRMGTGHVMRCIALGQAWQDLGGEVVVASSNLPQPLADRLEQENMHLRAITAAPASDSDADQTTAVVLSTEATRVVVDGYHFSGSFCQRIRDFGPQVMVIDDFGQAECADIVLDHNLYVSVDDYAGVSDSSLVLAGCRFALLRREFREQRDLSKRVAQTPGRILVSCGGSDPRNATEQILKSLDRVAVKDLEVVAVVGGSNEQLDELREISKSLSLNVRIRHNCRDMPRLMNWADLAIVAAGTTCLELACLGVPTIAVVTVENQVRMARSIEENGLGWNVGWVDQLSPERIPQVLAEIMSDTTKLLRAGRAGQSFVDGRGAMRVAQILADPVLTLRPTRLDDSRLLWQWRNDETVRQASFSTDPIPWEGHCEWFESRLQRGDCQILIAENDHRQPIGQVRLDLRDNRAAISISISSEYRASGYGTALIRAATNHAFTYHRVEYVDAFIRADNQVSQAAFMKAEYHRQCGDHAEENKGLHFFVRNPQPQLRAA